MLVVRAVTVADLDPVCELARRVGSGMTTLKPDLRMLGARLEIACASFAETIALTERDYFFVMEETSTGRLAGVCAIKAAVGLAQPFYNYRIGSLVHSSTELGVFSRMDTLYLSSDLTGSSELCSLFLHPDYRGNGRLLSQSRLLFMAQFPHLFADSLIAEMRGYQTAQGVAPFYEGLGRHFFKRDFDYVDDLTSLGKKSFIAELMPRHPLYLACLPPAAQEAVGKVHPNTAPARHLLEQEGLSFGGYIDIFDGGPVLQARLQDLRAVRASVLLTVKAAPAARAEGVPMLLSNTTLHRFCAILSPAVERPGALGLTSDEQRALACRSGDSVRALPLKPRSTPHV